MRNKSITRPSEILEIKLMNADYSNNETVYNPDENEPEDIKSESELNEFVNDNDGDKKKGETYEIKFEKELLFIGKKDGDDIKNRDKIEDESHKIDFNEQNASFCLDNSSRKQGFSSKSTDNLEFKGMGMMFIMASLENDKRVKRFERVLQKIYVHFWNIKDSISFYKQYFLIVEMSFSEYDATYQNNFELQIPRNESSFWYKNDIEFTKWPVYMDNGQIVLELNDDENILIEDVITNSQTHKEILSFEDKTNYFGLFQKEFTSYELKQMQIYFDNGNYDFLFIEPKKLAVGANTNVLVQETLKKLSSNRLFDFISMLDGDIAAISATKYGAYVVQTLISLSKDKQSQEMIKKNMKEDAVKLIKHPIGNYALQKISTFDTDFLANIFLENFTELIKDDLGYKVFKNCLGIFACKKNLFEKKVNDNLSFLDSKKIQEICLLLKGI